MQNVNDLRKEARRCLDAAKKTNDPETKRNLAVRSFELLQEAEALSRIGMPASN
jgi:hypothetical protein